MAVAWAVGAWATNSWVGMNAGPPNAWSGSTTVASAGYGAIGNYGDVPPRRRKKSKSVVIRYSDFESREEYERALAAQLIIPVIDPTGQPVSIPMSALPDDDEEDEDEAILHILMSLRIH